MYSIWHIFWNMLPRFSYTSDRVTRIGATVTVTASPLAVVATTLTVTLETESGDNAYNQDISRSAFQT